LSYIGRKPTVGNFQICDAISVVNGQAAYTMQVGSVNVLPETANHMIVSLNGTIQKPNSSFTVSGSTITFASNLVTNDVIDFIQILGDVLDLGVPSDATVTDAKTNFVSTSSAAGLKIKGDGTTDGTLQLNCSQNSHGIKIKSPPHSAGASYTLTMPNNDGDANQVLTTDGSGVLSFAAPAAAGKILQVKNQYNNSLTSNTATASTHFDICAGSMTFTPTSSSSNILCMLSAGMDTVSNGGNCGWSLSLSLAQSGGLAVSNDVKTEFGYYSAATAFGSQTYGQNLSFIESYANSSTNAITITGQGHNYSEGNSQTVKFQRSSLIVMEWVV